MKTNHWQLELEKTVRTMDKSVQRMLRLIDQLLEFRKMQAGKLKLSLQETDVVMFVQGICKMFDDAAESKQIDFKFESQLPAYLMYLDQQKWIRWCSIFVQRLQVHPCQGNHLCKPLFHGCDDHPCG